MILFVSIQNLVIIIYFIHKSNIHVILKVFLLNLNYYHILYKLYKIQIELELVMVFEDNILLIYYIINDQFY